MKKNIIPAINLHLTKKCNMNCKYCFARFNDSNNNYPYEETIELISKLRDFGFKKINFVGGEPMLIKNISQLIKFSKKIGFYTSIVTNGSLITNDFLRKNYQYLDMVGLSIDSLHSQTNNRIGRMTKGKPMTKKDYKTIVESIINYGISLKINTVVSNLNKSEEFFDFINKYLPVRWKIFQVLEVLGENDETFNEFQISQKEFNTFCKNQKNNLLNPEILIQESNEIIRGSYLMINPEGQFFDNTNVSYTSSKKIIDQGVEKSLNQINFDYTKFIKRDGNHFNKIKIAS